MKVLLMGPMGAGKSTLGKILSTELGWPYFDNDGEITSNYGLSASEVSALPIEKLHELESQYLRDVLKRPESFIAGVAASVIDSPSNRVLIESAFAIYLRLPLSKIVERAGSAGVGRQAIAENKEQILIERFNRRDPLYRGSAKLVIELSNSPKRDVAQIKKLLLSEQA
jgi:shikimate kinase